MSMVSNVVVSTLLIVFGGAFCLWTLLDYHEAHKWGLGYTRNSHRHHILLSAWSFLVVSVTLVRQVDTSDLTFCMTVLFTGIVYLIVGLRDLRREVVVSHRLENFMKPATVLTKCATLIPLWATLIVGVSGTLFGLDEALMTIFSVSGELRGHLSPYILLTCGLCMLFIYAKVIAWQNQELQQLMDDFVLPESFADEWVIESTGKHEERILEPAHA